MPDLANHQSSFALQEARLNDLAKKSGTDCFPLCPYQATHVAMRVSASHHALFALGQARMNDQAKPLCP